MKKPCFSTNIDKIHIKKGGILGMSLTLYILFYSHMEAKIEIDSTKGSGNLVFGPHKAVHL